MDPLRWCVLLALVLLEVAVCAENGECQSGKSNCEVTGVVGEMVRVECGGGIIRTAVDNSVYLDIRNTSELYQVESVTNRTLFGDTQESMWLNGSSSDFSFDVDGSNYDNTGKTLNNGSSYESTDSNPTDSYEKLTSDESNKTLNVICSDGKFWDEHLESISKIQVILLRNNSVLDLTCFSNLSTIILNSSGSKHLTICGAKNVTDLSSLSSKLEDVSFIQDLVNLQHLNLSNNSIKTIPLNELPTSVISIDLSYNSIIFDTNTRLPNKLRLLNVSYNNMTTIDGVILKGNVIILDIRGNRLEKVPVFDMNTLEELYLSRNNISVLGEGVFTNLSSLTKLDLKENRLSSLEENVFQGLNRLQWLDMSENNVMSLAPSTFQFLSSLITLSLSGNTNLGNLQEVEDAFFLFGTGQRLQVIAASRTNLTKIPSTLTRSVRKLHLSDNVISTIQCGELDSYPLLQIMEVANNLITDIEEDALGRLDFLSHLMLSGNKLTSIPRSLPDQLQVLDLRCNSIGKLNSFDFFGLLRLRVLLLSRNKIAIVEDGAFGQLSSLEVLDLSHNPIKSLSRTSFIGPRKLREIYLVSLTDLIPLQEPLSFPAPESAHLEILNMESSPVLATQLMDDIAALTMFHELFELNLNHCRLSTLRSDLPRYLPRLHKLELTGNVLNCTNIIWLVKWLQALNISMQDTGKFRREMYSLKDICCQEATESESYDEAAVICASPEYLSGKQIIALKEEDFPDLKLTSSTLPPVSEVFITEPYLANTLTNLGQNTSQSVSDVIDSSFRTTSGVYNFTHTISNELSSESMTESSYKAKNIEPEFNVSKMEISKNKNPRNYSTAYKSEKPSKLTKTVKSINRSVQKWRYIKSETKYKPTSLDPVVVLLNDTRSVSGDFDNHLNESISSGAFSAHELPPTSHPGMVVFLLVVGVILVASSAMVYAQCSQNRRGREYQQHQDIEVSSLGGNELW